MTLVTIATPIGPAHLHLIDQAREQARKQTVPCSFLHLVDERGEGPAHVRNRLLAAVQTPFVVFLDADDYLHPRAVFRMLAAYRPGSYVYGDHLDTVGPMVFDMDSRSIFEDGHHVVTTLLPVAEVRQTRGFRTDKIGFEDTDFYLMLASRGLCGRHVGDREPIMMYTNDGTVSAAAQAHPDFFRRLEEIYMAYENCNSCGGGRTAKMAPIGVRQEGDVLVRCRWGGNKPHVGKVTGRRYARNGNGKLAWVDPRDVAGGRYELVEQDLTTPVEPVTGAPELPEETPVELPEHFDRMTVKQLTALAAEHAVSLEGLSTPAELRARIRESLSLVAE